MLSPTNSSPNGAMPNKKWIDIASSVPARSPQGAIRQISVREGNDIECLPDADTPTSRLYAFKLGFARHMVKTHGCFCDYQRLRKVEEEARAVLA